jgi:hypothetical protein
MGHRLVVLFLIGVVVYALYRMIRFGGRRSR